MLDGIYVYIHIYIYNHINYRLIYLLIFCYLKEQFPTPQHRGGMPRADGSRGLDGYGYWGQKAAYAAKHSQICETFRIENDPNMIKVSTANETPLVSIGWCHILPLPQITGFRKLGLEGLPQTCYITKILEDAKKLKKILKESYILK